MPKKSTKNNSISPPSTRNFRLQQRIREGLFVLTLAVSLFLLLSLTTYHATDPGWSHSSISTHVINAGGHVGAWFADFLLYMFGYLAYLIPLLALYSAWLFLRHEDNKELDYQLLLLRTIGFFLMVVAGCGLASVELAGLPLGLPSTAGGILGQVIGMKLIFAFNLTGASLVLVALLLSGITLSTNLSWLKVTEYTGQAVLNLANKCQVIYNRIMHVRLTQPALTNPKSDPVEANSTNKRLAIKINISKTPATTKDDNETTESPKAKKLFAKRKTERVEPKVDKLIPEARYTQSRQADIFESTEIPTGDLPSLSLLDPVAQNQKINYSTEKLEQMSREVEQRLLDFNVEAQVVAVHPGPVITRYELQLAPGLKVSKISGLAKDLARSLSVISVRVVEVIPGKSVIGLELPNEQREVVRLSEIFASQSYEKAKSMLSLALGKDIAGHPVIVDLAKMPHLLVAGTTGSGKSVGVNAMILSILYKASPQDVRMIMIDPKMLELSIYEGIPHLLTPVVTDMKEAASALRWCVAEMERRYKLMAALGVRNVAGYNHKVREATKAGTPIADPLWVNPGIEEDVQAPVLEALPFVVVVIDEFADMMMVVGKKVEELIARIAQKARAAGIHLILATQRPSVDVITGLIKANIPTRIAFQVSSRVDSRTIIDQQGAEQLLGRGDMLYLPPGSGVPVRVHGAFVDDHEVHRVVNDWRKRGKPNYLQEIVEYSSDDTGSSSAGSGVNELGEMSGEADPLYDQAVQIVTETRRASISGIQRRLRIGYNRAARLVEEMERAGVVSPMESNGSREVLAPPPVES
ncbi:MAG: DNA translocase FtsK [Gammaproteobacteria bacterium]